MLGKNFIVAGFLACSFAQAVEASCENNNHAPSGLRCDALVYISKAMFSGRNDPGFSMTTEKGIQEIESFLIDLTPVSKVPRPSFVGGYFIRNMRAVKNFPESIYVYDGFITVTSRDKIMLFRDDKNLGAWLETKMLAKGVMDNGANYRNLSN